MISTIAAKNIKDTVDTVVNHTSAHKAFVLFDAQSELSRVLTEAYRAALPDGTFVDFDAVSPEEALNLLNAYGKDDLVVLIQSGSFRLNEFRLRVELFKLSIKVIEYAHLERIPADELETYVDALAYDASYYRPTGHAIKAKIDGASTILVESDGGSVLAYEGGFEDAKLNIGDYTGMKNVGGQFPIGEVFTEPRELARVNGTVELFAYGDKNFCVRVPEKPIVLTVKEGIVVDVKDGPPEFHAVLDKVQLDEPLVLRELGFGMNRAMTRTRRVTDIGAYERMCGVHMSLGGKHAIYAKAGFSRKHSKHHVDVFVAVKRVTADGGELYRDGAYVV